MAIDQEMLWGEFPLKEGERQFLDEVLARHGYAPETVLGRVYEGGEYLSQRLRGRAVGDDENKRICLNFGRSCFFHQDDIPGVLRRFLRGETHVD